jgi:choline dehydrogenase-like flavoprotein
MISRDVDALRHQLRDNRATVVVGSGAVGLFFAKCMLAAGHTNVVVVESGGEALGSFDAGSFQVIGRKHEGIRIGRSRSLGGTSNLWGGQLVEFSELDFRRRDWVDRSGWPISLADLKPHYLRAFEMLGIGPSFVEDEPIWRSVLGSVPRIGDDLEVFLTRWMNVPSMARQLRREIDESPALHVLLGHAANGFAFKGDEVTHVRLRTPTGRDELLPVGRVVIAAGTIESSRLMLAGALDPACPWRNNPMLGRRFQDHLGGRVAMIRPSNRKAINRIFATIHWKGLKFQPKVRLARAKVERAHVLASLGMVTFESSVTEHLQFLKQFLKAAIHSRRIGGVGDFFVHAAACARYLPPLMLAYLKEHRVMSPSNSSISLVVQAEQNPVDESCIRIDPSRLDASGLPRVLLDWRLGGNELESIRELAMECQRAFRSSGLGEVEIDPLLAACDPAMLERMRDTNHPAGGCIMSDDPATGVVDPSLRVFGTRNAFVLGASTFPTSSDANVTFTAMALACRLADHLSENSR